jgi:hypothetical protein
MYDQLGNNGGMQYLNDNSCSKLSLKITAMPQLKSFIILLLHCHVKNHDSKTTPIKCIKIYKCAVSILISEVF